MENRFENNRAELRGTVLTEPVFSHRAYGEAFHSLQLGILRRSGNLDAIPILVSERLIRDMSLEPGRRAELTGQIRTYNKVREGRNHLQVVAFAREFRLEEPEEDHERDVNSVLLDGFLCKPPVYRVSPLGREICDLILAVNRLYNKSDYIPCIAWGRNAAYTGNLSVGAGLQIEGRLQSREYQKKDSQGQSFLKVAYEVSITKIEDQNSIE